MKAGWTEVALGELCELRYGKSLRASDRDGGDFAVYGSNGSVGSHSAALTSGPTIVVGRKGSFGSVHFSRRACWPIDTTFYIDETTTGCNLAWLAFTLRRLRLNELNRAAAIPGLGRDDAYRQRLLLPPPLEQARIVRILDAASSYRTLVEASVKRTETLSGALWQDIISRGSTQSPLGKLLSGIESGRSPVCDTRPAVSDEWAVLKLGAVSFGNFRPGENKALLPGVDPDPTLEVRKDDVLLARKNTPELVGASVYVREAPPRLLLPDLIFRLVLKSSTQLRPRFFQAALARPETRAEIRRLTGGSAGSMPNISKERLRRVRVPVVSMASQIAYEEQLNGVDRQTERVEAQLGESDALFDSLQHRAFTGQL